MSESDKSPPKAATSLSTPALGDAVWEATLISLVRVGVKLWVVWSCCHRRGGGQCERLLLQVHSVCRGEGEG